jgi:hypothetical protein
VDGPLQYKESVDGKEMVLNTMSRFGRSFSIVSVPYSMKLLIQELQAMNIHMRIITDQNINQIESMTYSRNIEKLTSGKFNTFEEVAKYNNQSYSHSEIVQTPKQYMYESYGPGSVLSRSKDDERIKPVFHTPDYDENGSPIYIPPADASWRTAESQKSTKSPGTPIGAPPQKVSEYKYNPNDYTGISDRHWDRDDDPWDVDAYKSPKKEGEEGEDEDEDVEKRWKRYRDGLEMVEGGGKQSDNVVSHRVGDNVCYVKSSQYGLHPEHPWTVRKVGGRFYTIETELPVEKMGDSIQVVEPYEIYKPSPMMDNGWNQNPVSAYPVVDGNGIPVLSQPFPSLEETPKINIAPIIKIINGPDHSTNNGDPATMAVGGNNMNAGVQPVQTVSTGANNVVSLPSKINVSGSSESASSSSSTSSKGGKKSEGGGGGSFLEKAIDFSKGFFIKKVGA